MAVHNLFMGGAGPNGGVAPGTYNAEMFPSVLPGLDDYNRFDARRTPVVGGITRRLIWERPEGPKRTFDPLSPALASYLDSNPIAAGDQLRIILLPRRCTLLRVWWSIEKPLPGFDFDLVVEVPPPTGTTTPITTAPISAAAVADGLIDVPTVVGNQLYLDQNAVLRMDINNLPAGGIRGSDVRITAVVEQYEFGGN